MTEEKAEEYAREWLYHVKDLELHHKEDDKPEYVRIKQAYLDGLHEGQPKWHKVADGDLPKDDKQYLVLYYYNYKGKKEMSYGVRDNLHSDFEIHRNYTEQIIAWCEISQFKE